MPFKSNRNGCYRVNIFDVFSSHVAALDLNRNE